jgi:hypothetical protein
MSHRKSDLGIPSIQIMPQSAKVVLGRVLINASGLDVRFRGIVLQKSKIAGLQIFMKNLKREAIADSFNLNRATEVADEFNAGR